MHIPHAVDEHPRPEFEEGHNDRAEEHLRQHGHLKASVQPADEIEAQRAEQKHTPMRPAAPEQLDPAIKHPAEIENDGFLPKMIELCFHGKPSFRRKYPAVSQYFPNCDKAYRQKSLFFPRKHLTNPFSSYIITLLFRQRDKNGGIAQLVEHSVHTRSVICSSQIAATIRPVGQAVKTPPFHGGNMGSIPVRVTK